MTRQQEQGARLLRLRTMERRKAELRLARAHQALFGLEAIAARLKQLRDDMVPRADVQPGLTLCTLADMQRRLDQAALHLGASLDAARAERAHERDRQAAARQREDKAGERLARLVVLADRHAEQRADAQRPAPRTPKRMEP